MEINVTTFNNPFSFFCKIREDCDTDLLQHVDSRTHYNRADVSDVNHGQYVAVLWNNKWVRGVVSMESQFAIWLIDFGIFIRPDERTAYIDLLTEQKKIPTKVFEASIHGVMPIDKTLSEDCQIANKSTYTWNKGATLKAQALISSAERVIFVPTALLSTDHNDIVLGDLYLKFPKRGMVNIVDELQLWPIFLEKDEAAYIKSLHNHYNTRRKHRLCTLKPKLPYDLEIPTMSLKTTFEEYSAICEKCPKLSVEVDHSEESSVVVKNKHHKGDSSYKLTPDEIEQYSNMFIEINGIEFNVLHVLLNKIRDLNLCEKYKNYDKKSVGRANIRSPLP